MALSTEAWPVLQPETLTDQVYEALRDRIVAGLVVPGEFIRELEISDALGVSRTPVREALGRLASEGFLERIAHRGFRVPGESIAGLLELYPILATLEALACAQAFPNLDAAALDALRDVNRDYADVHRQGDVRAGIEVNDRFHHLLAEPCRNAKLVNMLAELRAEVKRLEFWTFSTNVSDWAESIRQHDEILESIAAGDLDNAVAVLHRNRLMTYDQLRIAMATDLREQ